MIKQSLSITVFVFAISFLSSMRDVAAEDLGFGYVRRGQEIHFEGGGKTGIDGTCIDKPSRENIDGFSTALERDISVCKSLDAASLSLISMQRHSGVSAPRITLMQMQFTGAVTRSPKRIPQHSECWVTRS